MDQQYYYYSNSCFALDDLEKQWVKVSRLDSLNDPFELLPNKRYKKEKRKQYDQVFERINNKWGLLCFSDSWNELLLWAHYADKHKGIALGFEILIDTIIDVLYPSDTRRPVINLTADSNENESNFLKLAGRKYYLWSYEKEHRILVRLDDCKKDKENYFLNFGDRLRLKRIVLGCKFDHNKYKERICKLAIDFGAEVFPTRAEWQGYSIVKSGARVNQYNLLMQQMTLGLTNPN